ncbi:helix-turn-helix domain-containing protein [Aquibacillus kalidii]|uniref:helix-turn-helix domain-containing protein n=1 Tax=Aquibacillus kalidii TaxID=2762597 RepID=UPI0016480B5B|nr:helix-turn-helix domain-containing protein [Aquibacillus kalidii]
MQFNNFCVSSMKIKSLWFGEKCGSQSIYKEIKEEGINLYLQLFRFRYHQIIHADSYKDYQYHVFRITLSELIKFTKINKVKRLSYKKLIELLQSLEDVGVIKNHTIDDWSTFDAENGKDKLIVLEATDVPKIKQIKDDKGKLKDDPLVKPDDFYITINYKTINYIYDECKLTSRELMLYLLLLRLSNGGEEKAWARIETMAEFLNCHKDKVSDMLIELNKHNLIATYVKKNDKKGIKFEHAVLKSIKVISSFADVHGTTIDKYLKRKGVKESEPIVEDEQPQQQEYNPFANLDEHAKTDQEWGESPISDDMQNDLNKFGLDGDQYYEVV